MTRALRVPAVIFAFCSFMIPLAAGQQTATPSSTIPEISADRGSCKLDFKVTNLDGRPIYNAKIHTQVKWGLFHKLDLDVATNSDGKARFVNMPNTVKSPLVFNLTNGADTAMLTWDPGTNCAAEYTVPLAKRTAGTSK